VKERRGETNYNKTKDNLWLTHGFMIGGKPDFHHERILNKNMIPINVIQW
jgi:hypothetical protein